MLSTDRLTIRPIEAADWAAVREIWLSVAATPAAQYDKPHNTDPADVRDRIARWADYSARGTDHMFFAACLNNRVIGYVAFNVRDRGHEIGYCFHTACHGRGYAVEALSALLNYLHSLGFHCFSAGTALDNTPSVRLLTSLGFRLTGTEQVSFYQDAQGHDIFFEGGLFVRET